MYSYAIHEPFPDLAVEGDNCTCILFPVYHHAIHERFPDLVVERDNCTCILFPVYICIFSYSWGYKRVFEQYAHAIYERFPDLAVEGDNCTCILFPVYICIFSYTWGYKRVFEQYAHAIYERFPDLAVEGDNYPPMLNNFPKLDLWLVHVFYFLSTFVFSVIPEVTREYLSSTLMLYMSGSRILQLREITILLLLLGLCLLRYSVLPSCLSSPWSSLVKILSLISTWKLPVYSLGH